MLTLIIFLAVLSVLVLAHELGHFLAARKAGIKVEEFGLGLPPRIWGKKIGGTIYSINALPIGGFVKLYGEELVEANEAEKNKKKSNSRLTLGDAFWAKSKRARLGVIVAGVVANFLLGILAFSVVYSVMGIPTRTDRINIVGVVSGSPAGQAGIQGNDVVLKINNQVLSSLDQFTSLINGNKGRTITIEAEREKQILSFTLVPRENPPEGEGAIGVVVSEIEMVHYPFWQMPFRGAVEGFKEAFGWAKLVLTSLGKMVSDLVSKGTVPKDVAGPIGIFQITGVVSKEGWLAILQFMGILSVNLAVVNFLPFPALDGGRLLFIAYEVITKKRPKPEFEHRINTIGMAFLLLLIALITINDVSRIWGSSNFIAKLRSLWPF